jgi:hypothetical protein
MTQEAMPAPTGPYLSSFTDDFDDNVVDPVDWSGSYGSYAETGGRARVNSTTDYSGYNSRYGWAFDRLLIQVPTLAALNGAVADCYTGIWVASDAHDAGTHVGFVFNRIAGELRMESRTGYFDAAAVGIAIDTTAQAWVQLRLVGPMLLWDTSPDGINWFTQRTSAAPVWVLTAERCKVLLESRRDAGTPNFSEFDNLNLPPLSEVTGAIASTLGGLTTTAVGSRTVAGAVASALGGISATATGVRAVAATSVATLGGLTATASGIRQASGATAATLGGLSATAVGEVARFGTATAVLGELVATADGVGMTVAKVTLRPSTGTTTRPLTTVTPRPMAGTTARPQGAL